MCIRRYRGESWSKVCPEPCWLIRPVFNLRFRWHETTENISIPPEWDASLSQVDIYRIYTPVLREGSYSRKRAPRSQPRLEPHILRLGYQHTSPMHWTTWPWHPIRLEKATFYSLKKWEQWKNEEHDLLPVLFSGPRWGYQDGPIDHKLPGIENWWVQCHGTLGYWTQQSKQLTTHS